MISVKLPAMTSKQKKVGLIKQGVALTGRNITGPPSRAAPW